jgi:hypothetical protein
MGNGRYTQGESNSRGRIKASNLAFMPLFLPNPEPNKAKNRLTSQSRGLFLENAPKEIHVEHLDIISEEPLLSTTRRR